MRAKMKARRKLSTTGHWALCMTPLYWFLPRGASLKRGKVRSVPARCAGGAKMRPAGCCRRLASNFVHRLSFWTPCWRGMRASCG